ncbi:MAG TPA: hypothetical protein VF902_09975 [Coriobacteriia bacterium]
MEPRLIIFVVAAVLLVLSVVYFLGTLSTRRKSVDAPVTSDTESEPDEEVPSLGRALAGRIELGEWTPVDEPEPRLHLDAELGEIAPGTVHGEQSVGEWVPPSWLAPADEAEAEAGPPRHPPSDQDSRPQAPLQDLEARLAAPEALAAVEAQLEAPDPLASPLLLAEPDSEELAAEPEPPALEPVAEPEPPVLEPVAEPESLVPEPMPGYSLDTPAVDVAEERRAEAKKLPGYSLETPAVDLSEQRRAAAAAAAAEPVEPPEVEPATVDEDRPTADAALPGVVVGGVAEFVAEDADAGSAAAAYFGLDLAPTQADAPSPTGTSVAEPALEAGQERASENGSVLLPGSGLATGSESTVAPSDQPLGADAEEAERSDSVDADAGSPAAAEVPRIDTEREPVPEGWAMPETEPQPEPERLAVPEPEAVFEPPSVIGPGDATAGGMSDWDRQIEALRSSPVGTTSEDAARDTSSSGAAPEPAPVAVAPSHAAEEPATPPVGSTPAVSLSDLAALWEPARAAEPVLQPVSETSAPAEPTTISRQAAPPEPSGMPEPEPFPVPATDPDVLRAVNELLHPVSVQAGPAAPAAPTAAAAVVSPSAPPGTPVRSTEYKLVAPVELMFADTGQRVGIRPGTPTFLKYQRLAGVLFADLRKARAARGD